MTRRLVITLLEAVPKTGGLVTAQLKLQSTEYARKAQQPDWTSHPDVAGESVVNNPVHRCYNNGIAAISGMDHRGIEPRTSTWLVKPLSTLGLVLKGLYLDVQDAISWTLNVRLWQRNIMHRARDDNVWYAQQMNTSGYSNSNSNGNGNSNGNSNSKSNSNSISSNNDCKAFIALFLRIMHGTMYLTSMMYGRNCWSSMKSNLYMAKKLEEPCL